MNLHFVLIFAFLVYVVNSQIQICGDQRTMDYTFSFVLNRNDTLLQMSSTSSHAFLWLESEPNLQFVSLPYTDLSPGLTATTRPADGLLEISAIASGAVDYVLGLKSIFGDVWVLNGNSLSSVNSLQWVPAVDISNSNFKSGFIDDSHAYVYSSEFRNTIEPIGKDKVMMWNFLNATPMIFPLFDNISTISDVAIRPGSPAEMWVLVENTDSNILRLSVFHLSDYSSSTALFGNLNDPDHPQFSFVWISSSVLAFLNDFGVQLVDNNGNAFGSQYLMNDVIDLRSIQTGAGFAVALREGGSFSIWQGSTDFGTISGSNEGKIAGSFGLTEPGANGMFCIYSTLHNSAWGETLIERKCPDYNEAFENQFLPSNFQIGGVPVLLNNPHLVALRSTLFGAVFFDNNVFTVNTYTTSSGSITPTGTINFNATVTEIVQVEGILDPTSRMPMIVILTPTTLRTIQLNAVFQPLSTGGTTYTFSSETALSMAVRRSADFEIHVFVQQSATFYGVRHFETSTFTPSTYTSISSLTTISNTGWGSIHHNNVGGLALYNSKLGSAYQLSSFGTVATLSQYFSTSISNDGSVAANCRTTFAVGDFNQENPIVRIFKPISLPTGPLTQTREIRVPIIPEILKFSDDCSLIAVGNVEDVFIIPLCANDETSVDQIWSRKPGSTSDFVLKSPTFIDYAIRNITVWDSQIDTGVVFLNDMEITVADCDTSYFDTEVCYAPAFCTNCGVPTPQTTPPPTPYPTPVSTTTSSVARVSGVGNGNGNGNSTAIGVGVGVSLLVIIIIIVVIVVICIRKRKRGYTSKEPIIPMTDPKQPTSDYNKSPASTLNSATNSGNNLDGVIVNAPMTTKQLLAKFGMEKDLLSGIKKNKKIGEGNFGVVFVGTWGDEKVALKSVKNPAAVNSFLEEIGILKSLRHPAIVQVYGLCELDGELCAVLEYCSKGDLLGFLKTDDADKLGLGDLTTIAISCLKAVEFLHSKSIIHRDVAARNYLVTKTIKVKMSDFGLSKMNDTYYGGKDTALPVRWCSPEVLTRQKYSFESDRYAFGITLFEIYSRGGKPFPFWSNEEVGKKVRNGEVSVEQPADTPDEIYKVIIGLTAHDVKDRMTFAAALSILGKFSPAKIEDDDEEDEKDHKKREKLNKKSETSEYHNESTHNLYQNSTV